MDIVLKNLLAKYNQKKFKAEFEAKNRKDEVYKKFGITLKEEVCYIGEFK